MPFFGVPGGFLDAAGKFGKLVGKGALSIGKTLGEELISAAKPVVMEEVGKLQAGAKDYIRGEIGHAAGFARRGLGHVREQVRGYVTNTNAERKLGVNDVTAFGDAARERAGATIIGAKNALGRLAERVAGSGYAVLDRAAARAEGAGNTTMEVNTAPLSNDLPNDVAARQDQAIRRNYAVNAANNAQDIAMNGVRRNKHRYDGRKLHRVRGGYTYRR